MEHVNKQEQPPLLTLENIIHITFFIQFWGTVGRPKPDQ